mmetsp:Transcript_13533/g.34773  ORF Transcript_13533/g.34773 Transcript_13533/m.34773 type:complete len:225 (-) Transcript_13533:1397-2071(-)
MSCWNRVSSAPTRGGCTESRTRTRMRRPAVRPHLQPRHMHPLDETMTTTTMTTTNMMTVVACLMSRQNCSREARPHSPQSAPLPKKVAARHAEETYTFTVLCRIAAGQRSFVKACVLSRRGMNLHLLRLKVVELLLDTDFVPRCELCPRPVACSVVLTATVRLVHVNVLVEFEDLGVLELFYSFALGQSFGKDAANGRLASLDLGGRLIADDVALSKVRLAPPQ